VVATAVTHNLKHMRQKCWPYGNPYSGGVSPRTLMIGER